MIRKKLPSAIVSAARARCASKISQPLAAMRRQQVAKRAVCQRFFVRPAHLCQSETMPSASFGILRWAPEKRRARQVLPCGRQKTPAKYLKNNKKYSPGLMLRLVQRIESRAASGYGIGVGEWG